MDRSDLDRLLHLLAEVDGSDLHVKAGAPPRIRVDGALRTLEDEPSFTAEETAAIARALMPERVLDIFERHHEADFAYSVAGLGRFRTNAFLQRGSVALAMRRVRTRASTVAELGLPDVVRRLADEQRGLVLVTGPTGSGKTTTLAAMVDHINRTRPCHIITIEDPVEYLHRDGLAAIDQREIGFDTESFGSAMRVVLRQDPDVILIGEMRDVETVYTALTAAETGHLVLSTLHTNTAAGAVTRLRDMGIEPFLLSSSLIGVLAQRLVRVLNPATKQPFICGEAERGLLNLPPDTPPPTLYRPGDDLLGGYRGRSGIYELIMVDEQLRTMIHDGASEQQIERHARRSTPSIRDHGRARVLRGETALEEVLRVTRED